MVVVYRFLSKYGALIFLILFLALLFALRALWRAWRDRKIAFFGLERDIANRRLARAISTLVLIFVLGAAEFFVTVFIVPGLPAEMLSESPSVSLATQTGTIAPEQATAYAKTAAAIPAEMGEGCVPGKIYISSPAPGEAIQGIVDLVGTVDIPNFGFYKFEISPEGQDSWATVYAGRNVIHEDVLGRLDTGELSIGNYTLRLVATDNEGNALPPCEIPIRVTGANE